jgi:hypothetical protein
MARAAVLGRLIWQVGTVAEIREETATAHTVLMPGYPLELRGPIGWTWEAAPAVFICGPTGFVEAAASLLVKAGHDASVIKTERFGPSGGQP